MFLSKRPVFLASCMAALLAATISCHSLSEDERPFVNTWRTVLDMPDGGLPFHINIFEDEGELLAAVRNGSESLPFTTVEVSGDAIRLVFDHYDCWFEGRIDRAAETITGEWLRRKGKGEYVRMGFHARAGKADRFEPIEAGPETPSPIADVTGKWDVIFGRGDDTWRSLAVLEQEGRRVTGTFLTEVGDFRFLEGTFEKGLLRLSVFDGCHSFLVRAEACAKDLLEGTFWFGKYGSPIRIKANGTPMPDPWSLTRIDNDTGAFSFSFPDTNGKMVSDGDPRFAGKPLVVCVIGTWCCNCYDAGALLAELYEEYHPEGLEMVCMACEFSGEYETDVEMMRRFARLWKIDWPILYVGSSSKKKTAEALPDLDRFLSYPTTLFIDRKGLVRKIHTGFTGPGTGEYYQRMCARFRAVIEEMLAE